MFEKTMSISQSDLIARLQKHPGMEPISTLPKDVTSRIADEVCDILAPGLEICIRTSIDSLIEMNKAAIENRIVEVLSGASSPGPPAPEPPMTETPRSAAADAEDKGQPCLRVVTKDAIDAFNATRPRTSAATFPTDSDDIEGQIKDKEHDLTSDSVPDEKKQ